ncbi:MAG TPA: division/cell wall cluster transcriptional repressor MraZ [Candidatus Binatia bacterium]|nr:division/cell wall cluster transcriptional repressor MraZ [Candidatus Binatia bacterium]
MFRGTFEHTIDDKGRVSVPAKYRDALLATNDDRVVITNFVLASVRCVDVYPYPAWLELENRLRQRPQFDAKVMQFQNYYVAGAHECQCDKQGRILLPPSLREYAQLDREVTFTAASEKFRIWNREAWAKVFADAEQGLMSNPETLSELGI